ncbi:GNAT family N-acetyltransferase [Blastopirellula sp. J2-11]|uniref:GNAT family N-acetyltransferase n=1 Tax=Blastopirellula sp. J2-11 TaxID=2943192 RepID=UPI0021C932E2|nr:GNAT family N-acetyltransferase [Blastopirellula sp. J2-11]UUO05245.1 GNAT family N-acetyltransferase [Blastopirellula sp. J2-11]
MFKIHTAKPEDAAALASLIHSSTNMWYESHGREKIFLGPAEDCRLFPEVYEDLDPGCCLVAQSEADGSLIGSCFYHPRKTHISLGIMNASSQFAGAGIASALLDDIVGIAEDRDLPVRLVSSALNLDSFSLYSRRFFHPYAVYQDMFFRVPEEGGLPLIDLPTERVRPATLDDVRDIDRLEQEIWQTSRERDWRYMIENTRGYWHCSVIERKGEITGAMASIGHPASNMIGPGVGTSSTEIAALIATELSLYPGRAPVALIPSNNPKLVAIMYALGGRNCELHLAQSLNQAPIIDGIVMPTFMPETC